MFHTLNRSFLQYNITAELDQQIVPNVCKNR